MPESRKRNKPVYKPIAEVHREEERRVSREPVRLESSPWLARVMSALLLGGLLYVVVFYMAGSSIPFMVKIGNLGNVGIGFGLMGTGFFLATRWR